VHQLTWALTDIDPVRAAASPMFSCIARLYRQRWSISARASQHRDAGIHLGGAHPKLLTPTPSTPPTS
jgi:hypothetical protein